MTQQQHQHQQDEQYEQPQAGNVDAHVSPGGLAALPRRIARAGAQALAAAQARFRRARSGSVLILVVALLVLIALAGTALITTARTDRYATSQNTANTQVEMLVDAVVRLAKSALVDDLFGENRYRPAPPTPGVTWTLTPPGSYENYDEARNDLWMASRLPSLPNPTVAPKLTGSPFNAPYWLYVSAPMVTGQAFESPQGTTYGFRRRLEPKFVRINGEYHPAFTVYDGNGAVFANSDTTPIIAADADGDGVADSGLWRIPVGQLNGVTYYAAARIIDNSAAFNANIHWSANRNSTSAPALPGDLFSTNVDFEQAFYQYPAGSDEFGDNPWPNSLNLPANNWTSWPGSASGTFYDPNTRERQMFHMNAYRVGAGGYPAAAPPVSGPPQTTPIADNGSTRTDFDWISPYDQWYHQFARRLDNPGRYAAGQRFRALTVDDGTSLAYRFVLRNPNVMEASGLEQMLISTLEFPLDPYRPVGVGATHPRTRTQPYTAPTMATVGFSTPRNMIECWYHENFDVMGAYRRDTRDTRRNDRIWSRRPLTVTRNPMANAAPVHSMNDLAGARPDVFGEREDRMLRADSMAFVPRTSINTAGFGELWRAFWSVMDATGTVDDANGDTVPDAAAATFRSPLRRPQTGTTVLSPRDTLLLRAACAAVNAMDYRDSDEFNPGGDVNQNVTSRRIRINADINGTPTPVEITVFGNEAQPFITEVYANNDSAERPLPPDPMNPTAPRTKQNPKGYVAVELYNPTNVTINLTGWHLGVMRRRTTGTVSYPDMFVKPITGFTGFTGTSGANTIAPGQRLVLENYNNGSTADNAAQWRPKTVDGRLTGTAKYIKNLHEVFKDGTDFPESGELVLLRPRRGDGSPANQPSVYGGWEYREMTDDLSKVNLDELVPLDSVDFTGFELAAPDAATYLEMHYVRKNKGTGEDRWKCVYPGHWLETGTGFRHEGMHLSAPFPPPMMPTDESAWSNARQDARGDDIKLGDEDDAANGYNNPYPGIQLNNKDFAGPNPVKSSGNRFPFGGFARNGDILGVPFVGAYTIRKQANADLDRGTDDTRDPTGRALLLEMNPVTHDVARARDNKTDTNNVTDLTTPPTPPQERITYDDDTFEQIGRFCPLAVLTPLRFNPDPTAPRPAYAAGISDPYGWALDLFDYLTVEAPHDDFLPNVARENYVTYVPNPPRGDPGVQRISPDPDSVNQQVNPAPIDGKINLNTAPARVLAALNMWPSGMDADDPTNGVYKNGIDDGNERLANMIVKWRDGDPANGVPARGPFYSIYDLNRVFDAADPLRANRFQAAGTAIPTVDAAGYQPTNDDGDFSPRGGSDEVSNDFEGRFLMMNRISNLVSTRSDSYTVYIVVQGWRGVNTANPTLVVQRRAAFLADRSGVTATNRDFTPVMIPTN